MDAFLEAGAPHHVPHFHAYYGEHIGVFSIDPTEEIADALPKRQAFELIDLV